MENHYSISVILPCYNVALFIERAMDSILMQDFGDYEVIIVNDGSPDNLLEVCEKWKNISNIKIITTPNQGVAQARNEGLNIAKGEYIYFMDPDDYLNQGLFSTIYKKAKAEDCDAIYFGHRTIEEYRGNWSYDTTTKECSYATHESIMEECLPKFIGFGRKDFDNWTNGNPWKNKEFASVWRFMFRRSLLEENNIRFSKGVKLSEDKYFVLNVLLHSTKVCAVEDVLYNYIMRANGGLVNSLSNSKNLLKAKIDGVVERAKLRTIAKTLYGEDIFSMYSGTIVLGAVEIAVRGVKLPISTCIKDVKTYMALDDVKEACHSISFGGLPLKFRLPSIMVKYHMASLLVVLIHFADKMGVKLSAF